MINYNYSWEHTPYLILPTVLISVPRPFETGEREPLTPTQGGCSIRVTTIYLPKASPGAHLCNIQRGKLNSWVCCTPTVLSGIRTQAYSFLDRDTNHCNMVAQW